MTREQRDRFMRIMEESIESPYRRVREYGRYLERYFNPAVDKVDGLSYQQRIENSQPMPYHIYYS